MHKVAAHCVSNSFGIKQALEVSHLFAPMFLYLVRFFGNYIFAFHFPRHILRRRRTILQLIQPFSKHNVEPHSPFVAYDSDLCYLKIMFRNSHQNILSSNCIILTRVGINFSYILSYS